MEENLLNTLLTLICDNPFTSTFLALLVSLIGGSSIFSFLRRPKKVSQGAVKYLADDKLLKPLIKRPAYSDRMAYVLAELSALAYLEFESSGEVIRRDAAKNLAGIASLGEKEIGKWLETFANDLLIKGVDSEEFLRKHLEGSDFKLLGTINVAETQGFVCKRIAKNEVPYVVVAYRGTEKKISDWLTDAKALPWVDVNNKKVKVHRGFREALMVETDSEGKTALQLVKDILDDQEAKDANNDPLPLFITGHSLGGALALLTTKEIAPDINGACYTYGAPRVASYEYFADIKTPLFRVVNSVDIVPRVPPGALMTLFDKIVQALSWVSGFMPAVSNFFDKLKNWTDKLKDYRHHGDQRYLTDIKSGRFDTVQLLSNPPAIDRLMWMGQHLQMTLLAPAKSHGMEIYREKLRYLADKRNRKP